MKPDEYQNVARAKMTEADFQRQVITAAAMFGWLVHHTRPAFDRGEFRTPIQGDPGFPDLVLARDGQVIFAELKSESGRLTEYQKRWVAALTDPDDHISVHVWKPADFPEIINILQL